ncbi:MAG: D-arabinono-1,4-lactone oxidase [Vicinamibacterales bacterium]
MTFATEPAFDVSGTETVLPDRGGAVDLFAEGETGLAAVLERNDYARVLWWPQRRVQRIVVWIANRTATEAGETRPYDPMPRVFGSLQPVQVVAGATLWCFVHWRRVRRLVGQRIAQSMERVARPIEAVIYRAFVDGDPMRPQCFRGAWHDILPQDQQMDERWMPTTFTEMFVPIERTADVLCNVGAPLRIGSDAAGRFAIELDASPPSSSWMHPSYGRASLRVNVFWLMHAPDIPRERFMARLWHALEPFAPRLHWGKLSPHEPSTMVAGRYPRFEAFLAIRGSSRSRRAVHDRLATRGVRACRRRHSSTRTSPTEPYARDLIAVAPAVRARARHACAARRSRSHLRIRTCCSSARCARAQHDVRRPAGVDGARIRPLRVARAGG